MGFKCKRPEVCALKRTGAESVVIVISPNTVSGYLIIKPNIIMILMNTKVTRAVHIVQYVGIRSTISLTSSENSFWIESSFCRLIFVIDLV